MGLLLFIIATILWLPLTLINFITVLIVKSKKHGFLKVINGYFFETAYDLDRFGNRNFRTLWNVAFRKTVGYKFGNEHETISSALGKNQRDKTLTIIGWIIVVILWIIDFKYWFKGGHCINSIKEF